MSIKQLISYFFHWAINVCLGVLKLKKRNPNIWLFGAWRGNTYSDNAKYLFEYVCQELPEIQAIWITKNKTVKAQLLAQNKICYLSHEAKARKLRLKAGYLFFTNGAHDVGNFDLTRGAYKIALWHGMPLKKIFFANNYFKNRNKNLGRMLQYYIIKVYNKAGRDLSIATSETAKQFLIESFDIPAESVVITGQPRNDAFFNQQVSNDLKKRLHHSPKEQFVLFMPTWRDNGNYNDFFTGEATYLDQIITTLTQDESFLRVLKERNIKCYIKPHPNRMVSTETKGNIMILPHSLQLDSQELLAAADVLITDYSSVFIDYALTHRPIHFYVPDLESYSSGSTGIFLNFDDFATYWFKEIESLKQAMINEVKQNRLGRLNADKINAIYNNTSLTPGQYSKNVIEAVNQH